MVHILVVFGIILTCCYSELVNKIEKKTRKCIYICIKALLVGAFIHEGLLLYGNLFLGHSSNEINLINQLLVEVLLAMLIAIIMVKMLKCKKSRGKIFAYIMLLYSSYYILIPLYFYLTLEFGYWRGYFCAFIVELLCDIARFKIKCIIIEVIDKNCSEQ